MPPKPTFDWITSDHHILHKNVSRFTDRPFPDGEDGALEMSLSMIETHNEMVAPTDTVWFLGDLAMGNFTESLQLASTMHGRKFLIPGNHDSCHPYFWARSGGDRQAKRAAREEMYRAAGFHILPLRVSSSVQGVPCTFCHFPSRSEHPNHRAAKFDQWLPERPPKGWIVNGHVHEKWKTKGRQVNVGVDAWGGRPASWDQLAEIVQTDGTTQFEVERWT